MRLDIILNDGFGDVIPEGYDARIRLRESVTDSMISVPINPPMAPAIVGAPTYFTTIPTPQTPKDLPNHNCLGFRHAPRPAKLRTLVDFLIEKRRAAAIFTAVIAIHSLSVLLR